MKMQHLYAAGLTFTVLAAAQVGSAETSTKAKATAQTAPQKAATQAAPKAAPDRAAAGVEKGGAAATADYRAKVLEVKQGGGYTFLRVLNRGKEKWAAIPRNTAVRAGQEVELIPGEVMTNFKSKSLGRTFDRILFSDGIKK